MNIQNVLKHIGKHITVMETYRAIDRVQLKNEKYTKHMKTHKTTCKTYTKIYKNYNTQYATSSNIYTPC